MKIFGYRDTIEVQGKIYTVVQFGPKGVYVLPQYKTSLKNAVWMAFSNLNSLYDRGELRKVA